MKPNVLITGTPGTGKTTLAAEAASRFSLTHVPVGDICKDNGYYEEWDDELECHVLDEDRLLDDLEERLATGGCIVDYHSSELFSERWFQAVFVVRTDNSILYQRLQSRGYSQHKITQNIECEIFQTLLEEARAAYKPEIVIELQNNTPDDMEANLDLIGQWLTVSTNSVL